MSEESSITARLASVQSILNAPKNQYNKFGKYPYRSCEDIIEAVKPLLLKEGLALLISDNMVEVGGRVYVEATARVAINDGIGIEVSAYAREPESQKGMSESQITGAASSYARKYALNGLFAIDDTKDADTMEHKEEKKESKETKKAQAMTIELLVSNLPKCKTVKELEMYMSNNKQFVNGLFEKENKEVIAGFSKRKEQITELGGSSQAQQ